MTFDQVVSVTTLVSNILSICLAVAAIFHVRMALKDRLKQTVKDITEKL